MKDFESIFRDSKIKLPTYIKNIFKFLLENNYLNNVMIDNLRNKPYSKSTFDCNYPVLVDINCDVFNKNKYYDEIFLNKYKICNDWYVIKSDKYINNLINWLAKNDIIDLRTLKNTLEINKGDKILKKSTGIDTLRHPDSDGEIVKYAETVGEFDRIEGLCRNLEDWYKLVHDFLFKKFSNGLDCCVLPLIPVILSDKKPKEVIKHDTASWIKTQINIYGKEMSKKQIQFILDHSIEEFPITGTFFYNNGNPYIEIYYTNVSINDYGKYIAYMCNVLAHEYFHYFHNNVIKVKTYDYKEWPVKVVMESLADIFSYLCLEYYSSYNSEFDEINNESYTDWLDMYGSSWPYAYALNYFVDIFNRKLDFNKVIRIIHISSFDMNKAYDEL